MPSHRLSHGRRGGAALAWAAGVFLAAQLTGGLLLDYVWPDVRSDWFTKVERLWRLHPENPDVLCLGSSRFGAALQPVVMQAAFREELGGAAPRRVLNAAVPAGDPISDDYWLKRLLREGARPKMVLVEVDPDMVNGYSDWFGIHVMRQMRWGDVPAYVPEAWQSGDLQRLACTRLFPLYVYRREVRGLVTDPPRSEGDEEGLSLDWNQLLRTPQKGVNVAALEEGSRDGADYLRHKLRNYHIGGLTDTALDRLLARCRARHIDAVLVGVPVTSTLRELYTPKIDAAYRDYMARLCQKYGCRFVDWRDETPDADFKDIHHMQLAGAGRFSRRLTLEVLAPAWRAARAASGAP